MIRRSVRVAVLAFGAGACAYGVVVAGAGSSGAEAPAPAAPSLTISGGGTLTGTLDCAAGPTVVGDITMTCGGTGTSNVVLVYTVRRRKKQNDAEADITATPAGGASVIGAGGSIAGDTATDTFSVLAANGAVGGTVSVTVDGPAGLIARSATASEVRVEKFNVKQEFGPQVVGKRGGGA